MSKLSGILALIFVIISGFEFYQIQSYYVPIINAQQETIYQQNQTIDNLSYSIGYLQHQLSISNATITNLEGHVSFLLSQIDETWQGNSSTRNFNSLEELEQFLANDSTHIHQYLHGTFECFEFAIMLSWHAFEKGYRIYTIDTYLDYLDSTEDTTFPLKSYIGSHAYYLTGNHMVNIAYVNGSGWYLIEPQSNGVGFIQYFHHQP